MSKNLAENISGGLRFNLYLFDPMYWLAWSAITTAFRISPIM